MIDNDATCEPGKVCFEGRCLMGDDARAAAEAQAMTADGGAGVRTGPDGGTPPPGEGPPPGMGGGPAPVASPGDSAAKPSSLWACTVAADVAPAPSSAGGWLLLLAALGLALRRRSRSR